MSKGKGIGGGAETLRSKVSLPIRACFPRIEVMGHPGPWRACGRTGGAKGVILSEERLAICNSFTFFYHEILLRRGRIIILLCR